jgi:hypothetical protein
MSKPTPNDSAGLPILSRRNFMGVVGSSLVPASLPVLGSQASVLSAQANPQTPENENSLLRLRDASFFHGRQYFVLRSGRAQMVIQADRADLGPAVTYLVFDSQTPHQSSKKSLALNYVAGEGVVSSGLEVQLGGFRYTALGHRTETQWVVLDGVPAVEAVWWAGGVRVTEQFLAQTGTGVFQRSIRLEGANLVGEETITLLLSLPAGRFRAQGATLLREAESSQLAIVVQGGAAAEVNAARGSVDIGPLRVAPQSELLVHTALLVQIPPAEPGAMAGHLTALASDSGASAPRATKEAWASASRLSAQDATIQALFDRARYGLPAMIADNGSMNAGIFEYGMQWARDTSNSALGAIQAGFFEVGRAALEQVLTRMISDQGATMISNGYDEENREELDQMGEVLHALKAYLDWTGDDSLLREHGARILALIERPLSAPFRDATGLVHSRREFWERTFDDAYELAYQTYVIQGLRDAAEIAPQLGVPERAAPWRAEAERTLEALLSHPTHALASEGRLIKRRNVSGEIAAEVPSTRQCDPSAPMGAENRHRLEPDASTALPIALGVVDPASPLARRTLENLEGLWNMRWSDGGYERYHSSSQLDQPGPWTFATCFILRAQHEARLFDRSRRSLEWLSTLPGAASGAWFEEISSLRSQSFASGIIPWTSAEIITFVIAHWLGIRFQNGRAVIRPNLYPGSGPVSADLRFRKGRLRLEIDGCGPIIKARVNGSKAEPARDGSLNLPADFVSGSVAIQTKRTAGQGTS